MKKIGIIGIGNTLRQDDGVGIFLLNKLIKIKDKLPKNIDYIDGGISGINLIHLISKYDLILFIDAVKLNNEFDESKLFDFRDIKTNKTRVKLSIHEEDIYQIISLSKKIYKKPDKVYIFGVKIFKIGYYYSLSKNLEEKIPIIFDELIKKINEVFLLKENL
jgi:hydrogenase maturation protease